MEMFASCVRGNELLSLLLLSTSTGRFSVSNKSRQQIVENCAGAGQSFTVSL